MYELHERAGRVWKLGQVWDGGGHRYWINVKAFSQNKLPYSIPVGTFAKGK